MRACAGNVRAFASQVPRISGACFQVPGELPGQEAEDRGFEPRMGSLPNRISSAVRIAPDRPRLSCGPSIQAGHQAFSAQRSSFLVFNRPPLDRPRPCGLCAGEAVRPLPHRQDRVVYPVEDPARWIEGRRRDYGMRRSQQPGVMPLADLRRLVVAAPSDRALEWRGGKVTWPPDAAVA